MHCHILPGVDDGARNLDDSCAMLAAAASVGVTEIVCTPHCRDPYFDFDAMWAAFRTLQPYAAQTGISLHMGFEVNHMKLVALGVEHAGHLKFADTNEFLLELSTHASPKDFKQYEATIYRLQGMGMQVIIAHPERYRAIQKDIGLARNLVDMGCKLQVSADFVDGGRFGRERKPAKRLLDEGLVTYIASDAHNVEHYDALARACRAYGQKAG